MRAPHGYATVFSPDQPLRESDTLTCHHCGGVYTIPPFAQPRDVGGFCGGCFQPICPTCDQALQQTGICLPWEKRMDQLEKRDRLLRQLGIPHSLIGTLVHADHEILRLLGPNV